MAEAPQKKARTIRPVNPFVVVEQQLRLSARAQLEEVANETESLDALTSAVQTIVDNMPPCKVKGESLHLLSAWHQRRRDLTAAGNTMTKPITKTDVVRNVFRQVQNMHPDLRLDALRPPSPQTCLSIAAKPGLAPSDADLFRNLHVYLQEYSPELIAIASESTSKSSTQVQDTTTMVLGLRTVPVRTVSPSHTEHTTTDSFHTDTTAIEIKDAETQPQQKKKSASNASDSKVVRRNLNPTFQSAHRDEASRRRFEEFGSDVIKRVVAMLPLQVSFRRPLRPEDSPDGLVVSAALSSDTRSVEFKFTYYSTKEACTFQEFREKAMARTVASRDHLHFTDQPSMLYARKSPSSPWRRLQSLIPVAVLYFLDDMALRQFVARDNSMESSSSLETV